MRLPGKVYIEEEVDGFFARLEEPISLDEQGRISDLPSGYSAQVFASKENGQVRFRIQINEHYGFKSKSSSIEQKIKTEKEPKQVALDFLLRIGRLRDRDVYFFKDLNGEQSLFYN
mgnify:CR=1 FL=1